MSDWSSDVSLPIYTSRITFEVGTWHEAILRRARCAKNTKVKLRVDRERKSQKRIGFLHESDGSVDLMRLERGNTIS